MSDIVLIKSDARLLPLEPQICECGNPATHFMEIDFRAISLHGVRVDEFCERCGQQELEILQASLAEDSEQSE